MIFTKIPLPHREERWRTRGVSNSIENHHGPQPSTWWNIFALHDLHKLSGRNFHQVDAQVEKGLALVEESQISVRPGPTSNFLSLSEKIFWGYTRGGSSKGTHVPDHSSLLWLIP